MKLAGRKSALNHSPQFPPPPFPAPIVYSIDRSKAVVPVLLTFCCFVVYPTRRFVLRFAWCCFVLVFFGPSSNAITSLGEERANLSAFRAFVRFALV